MSEKISLDSSVIQSYVHFLMCNLKKMNLLFIKKELLN